MKVVIPGGTCQVGGILRRALSARGHEVVVLSRHPGELEPGIRHVAGDGRELGPWAAEIDGADAVVNLAGRTVSCRYTSENLQQMMDSRVQSTQVVGKAIVRAASPPRVWLQMSTATIYADRRDAPNDEATGVIGGDEPAVPDYWEYSVRIARCWEAAQLEADLPHTRLVALRAAMVMSPDPGGVFDVLLRLARLGLGGPVAGGGQYVSWIHDHDFMRSGELLLEREDLNGPVNLAAPEPVPQRDLMRGPRVEGSGSRLRSGWPRSVLGHCAATPNCSSRAAASFPAGCSIPASSSSTPNGQRPQKTSSGACARAEHPPAPTPADQPPAQRPANCPRSGMSGRLPAGLCGYTCGYGS